MRFALMGAREVLPAPAAAARTAIDYHRGDEIDNQLLRSPAAQWPPGQAVPGGLDISATVVDTQKAPVSSPGA